MVKLELKQLLASKNLKLNEREKIEYKMSDEIELIDINGYLYTKKISDIKKIKKIPTASRSNKHSIDNIKKFIINNNLSCKLVSREYIGNKDKLIFKCKCGEIFNVCWAKFQYTKKEICNECVKLKMSDKFRTPFDEISENYIKRGFILLSPEKEYKNNKSNLAFADDNGYKYYCMYSDFLTNKNFNIVSKYNIYSIENIRRFLKINNSIIELISNKYIDCEHGLLFKCDCGEMFYRSWNTIRTSSSKRCDECNKKHVGEHNSNNPEVFINMLNSNGYYVYSGQYKNSESKLTCIDTDGYKYLISYSSFRSTLSSSAFSSYNPFTISNIKKYIKLNNIDAELLSDEYVSVFDKLKFKCGCGNIFYRTLDSFKNGSQTRCLTCSNSKSSYEIKTEEILEKIGITYTPQYPIKIKHRLHIFDYYFPNILKMIEVDGEQHFIPISKFGGKDAFEDRIKRDLEKNEYCKKNQISLLRIPYCEFNNNNYSNLIKKFLEYD